MRDGKEAALVALDEAESWCRMVSPIFGGPSDESVADWMDRLIEFGLAARFPGCGPCNCDFGPWHHARWRSDRARRDCKRCGHIEMGRHPLRRFGFGDEEVGG